MSIQLKVVHGTKHHRTFDFTGKELLIGRSAECQLRPASDLVSRRHCSISRRRGHFFLEDCGSTNGTFLNGQRISDRRQLMPGDRLSIGPLEVQVVKISECTSHAAEKPHKTLASGSDLDVLDWLEKADLDEPPPVNGRSYPTQAESKRDPPSHSAVNVRPPEPMPPKCASGASRRCGSRNAPRLRFADSSAAAAETLRARCRFRIS